VVSGQTGCDRSTSTSAGSSSCNTPSGDEEVNHNQPIPLKFSTSPPVDVHKPRRSLSPQAGWPPRSVSPLPKLAASPERPPPMGNLSSSLGDLPCLMSTGDDSSSYSSRRRAGPGSCYSSSTTTTRSKKSISPRKRSRTSRVHHIQRPCLDFEKMQQLRAPSVSWRHGGELSLFCW